MSKVETFAHLVEAIQLLPTGHRKMSLAIACNETAREFRALADEVHAAAKASARKAKPATKRRCR